MSIGQDQSRLEVGPRVLLRIIQMRLNVGVKSIFANYQQIAKSLTEPNRCRDEGYNPVITVYRTYDSNVRDHGSVRCMMSSHEWAASRREESSYCTAKATTTETSRGRV